MIVENEEKRTKIWRIVFGISTIAVVIVAVMILVKMFTTNPISGSWQADDGSMEMNLNSSNVAKITLLDGDEKGESVEFRYTLSRSEKKVSFQEMGKSSDNGLLNILSGTFNYNVEGGMLTLTNPEYGEQYMFEKK
ncbi:hypothetical protein M2454_001822 [Aequitasia blattaphilus]|uniref:DUF5640 domain-containing protein n=1 Tax=Aequitasia blattaphilus TaxID=2949332 RepID=A0ABT1E8Y7_9FIRM|nr:hypothetical protein [Aequitasia blattaphilus]MCP1102304.1 hypothetical protein [Aequitasia blattaphilus]MCR8614944.1 hypothetical protein [Aequitasia blattaphilus]